MKCTWDLVVQYKHPEYYNISCQFVGRSLNTDNDSLASLFYVIRFVLFTVVRKQFLELLTQAFRFMVGPGHCPMLSKYGPLLSKAVGPVDPSFLVVKKSHFNKYIHLTASLRIPQNRKYM